MWRPKPVASHTVRVLDRGRGPFCRSMGLVLARMDSEVLASMDSEVLASEDDAPMRTALLRGLDGRVEVGVQTTPSRLR